MCARCCRHSCAVRRMTRSRPIAGGDWSRCPGSNWRPRPYQGRALPTELHRPDLNQSPSSTRPPYTGNPAKAARQPSPGSPADTHRSALRAGRKWSGRRGSNPRPTAWKAVTLPLSYSRLRRSPTRRYARPCALRLALRPAQDDHLIRPHTACHERTASGRIEWWGGEGSNLRSH